MEFVPVPGVLDDPSFLDGPKPLNDGGIEYFGKRSRKCE